jgi:hypothetical protein
MTALVIEADDPLDNLLQWGRQSLGLVRILIETKPEPIYVAGRFRLDKDHWPVRGMKLPVTIDPADPGSFEVRWDEVASIEERAAANDPTLADPVGTRKKTLEALVASGVGGPGPGAATQDVREIVVAAQAATVELGDDEGFPDHFKESMEHAVRSPAPTGKARAVALIATSEATLRSSGNDLQLTYHRDRHGKHDAVLAVHIPGRAPYAVFKPKFKHRRGKGAPIGAGLPALVSYSDPTDVEVLWDELLSVKEQGRQTAAEAMQAANERMAEATKAMSQDFQQGWPAPPAANPGVAGFPQMPAAMPQMPANMQSMMAENAKAALALVKDPAMRAMLIAQYRAAGIEIDDAK